MKKVTGVGGVFFKSKDVAKLKDWYKEHLGFITTDWGASMMWTDPKTQLKVRTEWSPFKESSDYFAPSTLPYMINYIVHDIRALTDTLRKEGVTIVGDIAEYDYGKFAHIMDLEGRKIELYEPADAGFGDAPPEWTHKVVGLGGIFFRSDNPDKMKEWYKKHLDIDGFLSPMTAWTSLKSNDEFFAETSKPYVFSYRVRDLDNLLDQLKAANIEISKAISKPSIGKFAFAIDPDGNKVAFWQPIA